jgi:L-threonylcarbamoyladenylate synthase
VLVSSLYDCGDPDARATGLRHAADALRRGELVVLPTDTVYGVAADAFSPEAVAALLAAKGRGRAAPPPVLVPDVRTLDGLAVEVPDVARTLVEAFWPGPLTVVCWAQPSLRWDLGDTGGTVAVRMPQHDVALELLAETGPLAVSSANRTGQPPATTAEAARDQLGEAVVAYLDGGATAGSAPSTIVDATGPRLRVLRSGALDVEALRSVVPEVVDEAVADG